MKVLIVGCGVVGAAIAYELSQVEGLNITVVDRQPPARDSTGAALGVLMGIISQKVKGNAWRMRQISLDRYETLVPELEAITGRQISFNRQGILSLCLLGDSTDEWQKLQEIRYAQGFPLEIWDAAKLKQWCPQVDHNKVIGAVYSPRDRQIDPTALTLALVDASRTRGVTFQFGVNVLGIESLDRDGDPSGYNLETTEGKIPYDWLVMAAGLGSSPLLAQLEKAIDIRPVLGQALQVRLESSLGNPNFQPVITGHDVHIVPVGGGDYWIGATVEFPNDNREILAKVELLESVRQQAIAFCPELASATVTRVWSGLRPRPEGRPAPVISQLPGCTRVLLATGHYRNGVLLAPATACTIREMIEKL